MSYVYQPRIKPQPESAPRKVSPDRPRPVLSPIAKRRMGGILVGGLIGVGGWALGSGIVGSAETSRLLGQVERNGSQVETDYVNGVIDPSKVTAVTVPAQIGSYAEASKIVKDPANTELVSDIITDQNGDTLGPDTVTILPNDLIKPSPK